MPGQRRDGAVDQQEPHFIALDRIGTEDNVIFVLSRVIAEEIRSRQVDVRFWHLA
jgi:hypothetical protein